MNRIDRLQRNRHFNTAIPQLTSRELCLSGAPRRRSSRAPSCEARWRDTHGTQRTKHNWHSRKHPAALHVGDATVQYTTVQYSTPQRNELQYCMVWYGTLHYTTPQHSTVRYSTVHVKDSETCLPIPTHTAHMGTPVSKRSRQGHKHGCLPQYADL